MSKPKTLPELLDEHAALERDFLPFQDQITEVAKKALALQIDIFDRQFKESFPKAKRSDAVLLTTLSAREKPAKFSQLAAAVAQKNVEVTHVLYDPMNFAYHIYGKANP